MTDKNAGVLERVKQGGKMISIRVDPKIRYLAELAATVRDESLTSYLEWALEESFKKVTLRVVEEAEPFLDSAGNWQMPEAPDPAEEQTENEAKSIGNLADLLWSDNEYVRMLMLSRLAQHVQTSDDKALLNYVEGRKDLWVKTEHGRKPNREKINAEWKSIKVDFAKAMKGGKA